MAEVSDDALVVLVLQPDGRADLTVAATVDDAQLAAYVHQVAEMIGRGEHRTACTVCAEGGAHEHETPETDPAGE